MDILKKLRRLLFDRSLVWFLIIGGFNTVLSLGITYSVYAFSRWAGLSEDQSYWFSSATAYTLCSILSFILNRRLSFQYKGSVLLSFIRFTAVIICCYLLAYSLARPLTADILTYLNIGMSEDGIAKVAFLVAQVIFTGFNYLGQRFFAFRKKTEQS